MNIYSPYNVVADAAETLHLKKSKLQEDSYFIKARVLPIALALLVWFVLQQVGSQIPMAWNYTIAAIVLLFAAMLSIRKNISEIKIEAGKEILLTQKTIIGTKQVSIQQPGIENIILAYSKSTAGGAIFILKTKSKKTYLFLHIIPEDGQAGNINLVKQNLEKMLGINIWEQRRASS